MNQTLTLSWCIGLPQWETDEAFARLLTLLREHRTDRMSTGADSICITLRNIPPWGLRVILFEK